MHYTVWEQLFSISVLQQIFAQLKEGLNGGGGSSLCQLPVNISGSK